MLKADKNILSILSLIIMLICLSCGLKKKSDQWQEMTDENWTETNAALERFVQEIENSPAKWQSHMEALIKSLGDNSQALIRNELSKMSTQLSMDMGNQFSCSSKVIPDILNKKMSWLSRQLLLKKGSSKKDINFDLPILLCALDQNRIDLNIEPERRNVIRANGYGFYESELMKIRWVRDDGSFQNENSKKMVYKSSDFQYTIDLSEIDDNFMSQYDHLAFVSNDIIIAELPIIHKVAEDVKSELISLVDFDHYPKHDHGDKDFNRDIKVWVRFQLFHDESKIACRLFMQAKENGGDKTMAKSWSDTMVVYRVLPGRKIVSVNNENETIWNFDVLENFDMGGKKPIPVDYRVPFRWGSLIVRGETRGDDLDDGEDSCFVKYRSGGKMLSIQTTANEN